MDYNNFRNLFIESLKFRRAIEECDRAVLPASFVSFPEGSCAEASLILSHYLKEKGFGEFEYISGSRMGKTHGWLRQAEIIIDITADRFVDNNEKVIVTVNPIWHNEFKIENIKIADINAYNDNQKTSLLTAYNEILKNLNHNE
jgi:hypothetical protein